MPADNFPSGRTSRREDSNTRIDAAGAVIPKVKIDATARTNPAAEYTENRLQDFMTSTISGHRLRWRGSRPTQLGPTGLMTFTNAGVPDQDAARQSQPGRSAKNSPFPSTRAISRGVFPALFT